MAESDLVSSKSPQRMLDHLRGRVGPRKLRLFACACVRAVWHLLPDGRGRRAVEVAERFADGQAREEERQDAWLDVSGDGDTGGLLLGNPGSPERLVVLTARDCLRDFGHVWWTPTGYPIPPAAQAALLCCISGDPWRPVALARADWRPGLSAHARDGWVSHYPWLSPTVVAVARAAYDERRPCGRCKGQGEVYVSLADGGTPLRSYAPNEVYGSGYQTCPACHGAGTDGLLDPDRLSILADALEETGCQEGDMLRHLRGPGPHARGCWALDLVLGKD
jgi:hypothetical protein